MLTSSDSSTAFRGLRGWHISPLLLRSYEVPEHSAVGQLRLGRGILNVDFLDLKSRRIVPQMNLDLLRSLFQLTM